MPDVSGIAGSVATEATNWMSKIPNFFNSIPQSTVYCIFIFVITGLLGYIAIKRLIMDSTG